MTNKKETNRITLSRRGLVGLFLIAMCIGGAAALTALSNQETSSYTVQSGIPISLTWNTNPSNGYMKAGDTATGELGYVNNHNSDFVNLKMYIYVQVPDIALTDGNFEVVLDGITASGWSNEGNGLYCGNVALADILNGESGSWSFTFTVIGSNGECDGDWTVDLVLYGNAA